MTESYTPPGQMPALVLAYIGDAAYELYVRRYLISIGNIKVKELHRKAVKFVNASTQARILHALEGLLTGEEEDVVRRGRNAKSGTAPKNVDMIDYRYGTAFEALFGYLYMEGNVARMNEIFDLAIKVVAGDRT